MSLWYPCVYCTEDMKCTKYSGDGVVSFCVLGPCSDEKKSNADRIRGMTDEELAIFLCENVDCAFCESIKGDCTVSCKDRMMLWLKSPVEEGDK